jgi:hypothetical protein
VMRCRPERRIQIAPVCRAFPTGEADAGTRTPDPIITSDVLYQLSYVGVSRPRIAGEPANRDGRRISR